MSAHNGPDGSAGVGRIHRSMDGSRGDEARLERLSAYMDGWVTDSDRSAVERELATDPAAREALDDLRLARTALSHLETPRAPRSFALAAAPARRPVALFRRIEWATRGAAGLAVLAFAFALVHEPQASEIVPSAIPATAAQERKAAPVVTSAAEPPAKGRETATQTLNAAPGGAAAGAATSPAPTSAASQPADAGATQVPAPAPAPAVATADTPAAGPRSLQAPASTSAPGLAPPSAAAPTSAATVGATRFAAPSVPAPATPVAEIAPALTPTIEVTGAKSAETAAVPPTAATPPPGTASLVETSEDLGQAGIAPALGVLALLLGLLALIEGTAGRSKQV